MKWRKDRHSKDERAEGNSEPTPVSLDPPRKVPVERGMEMITVHLAVFRAKHGLRLPNDESVMACPPITWLNMSRQFHDEREESNGEDEAAQGERSTLESKAKETAIILRQDEVTGALIADPNALSNIFYSILEDRDAAWNVRAERALRFLLKIPMAAHMVGDVDAELEEWGAELGRMIKSYADRFSPDLDVVVGHHGRPPGWEDLDGRLRQSFAQIGVIVTRNWALLREREMENKFLERAVLDEMKDRGDRFHPAFFASGRVARAAGVDTRDLIRDEAEDEDEEDYPEVPQARKRGRPRKTDPETAE